MSSSARSTRRRLVLSFVSGLLLVAIGAGSALASSQPAGPGAGDPRITSDLDAKPVVLNPRVTGAQPIPFDHVTVGPDGKTLTIYFWHGVEGCYGVKDVTVSPTDGGYAITVWAGMIPEAISRTCIDLAQLYSYDVVLDEPVFTFGGLD
jgi:hypothetical protein